MSAVSSLFFKTACTLGNLKRTLREQSRFKLLFILIFGTAFVAAIWLLFLSGFRFLDHLGGAGVFLINRLFALFFLGLAAMLVMSGGVASYATLFRSEETDFLLVRPYEISHVVFYKYLESMLLSSWASFLVIIPFAGAYAWHEHMTILFSLWTMLFSIPLLMWCSSVGMIFTLLVVRWVPRRRYLHLAALAAVGLAAWIIPTVWRGARHFDESNIVLSRIIPGFTLSSNPLLPSSWVSEGISAFVQDQWRRGIMLWGVLVSNVLLAWLVLERVGSLTFYEAWQRVAGAGASRRRRLALAPLDRWLSRVRPDTRALVMKDIRTFLRDPAQWSQALIFFGLLTLYFINLRSFRYHRLPDVWRNLIVFLNVFSVSTVLCSLSSRFVYPQLSLEGHAFWLIGLAPTTARRVVAAKFGLAVTSMLAVSASLMWLSTQMLKMTPLMTGVAIGLAMAVSLAASGLSVGLGAIFLDLRHRNPAAIVSGFGGTLNLVLSMGFMLMAILPFAFAFHCYFSAYIGIAALHRGLVAAGVWLLLITTAATALPLRLGARSLSRHEF